MKSEKKKFYELLKSFDDAMLVTHHEHRAHAPSAPHFHARPMRIAEVTPNLEITFLTSIASPKVDELGLDAEVSVICQTKSAFVAVSGTASVSRDPERIAQLWKDSYKVWLPKGKVDPDLAIITVRAEDGEYWDPHGTSSLKLLVETAKAYVLGKPMEIEHEHSKARLSPPRPTPVPRDRHAHGR